MTIFDRIRLGLGIAEQATSAPDFEERLNQAYTTGELDRWYVQKVREEPPTTRIQAYKDSEVINYYFSRLWRSVTKAGELPKHGDPGRDESLAEFWKTEPILSGAVYSMSAKMTAMRWTVTGKKKLASGHAKLLARAITMGPKYDWGDFISASAQDYYTTDRGVFWEVARQGKGLTAQLADLAHIDALACNLTGSAKFPMIYDSHLTGQRLKFQQGEYIHFSSLKSPREEDLGIGFCAVSRAYQAAKLLLGLHEYDTQKLSNLPPEGVAAVNGLTKDEFIDAMELWKAEREKTESHMYPGVLWLLASMPNVDVGVDLTGFSQMPESFDRSTVVEQYVNILALVFGVDAREFWPISTSTLGTAAESEIQHMKAKGKGPGEFISTVERQINGEMPEGAVFSFDTQDIEEDMRSAEIAKLWVEALLPLTQAGGGGGLPGQPKPPGQNGQNMGQVAQQAAQTGKPGAVPGTAPGLPGQPMSPTGEPFLKREHFMRLLADKGVIPNWMAEDNKRTVVLDSSVQEKAWHDDDAPVIYTWEKGILSVKALPAYVLVSEETEQRADFSDFRRDPVPSPNGGHGDVPMADLLKEIALGVLEDERRIRGKPIPDGEALRGSAATVTAVQDEIERWRNHPILSKYVPSEDEDDVLTGILANVENQTNT